MSYELIKRGKNLLSWSESLVFFRAIRSNHERITDIALKKKQSDLLTVGLL